jgi:hypothetical protein
MNGGTTVRSVCAFSKSIQLQEHVSTSTDVRHGPPLNGSHIFCQAVSIALVAEENAYIGNENASKTLENAKTRAPCYLYQEM